MAERSLEAERERRKRDLAVALRVFARLGFDDGVAGHLSARDPLRPDCFWVNPFGADFAGVRASHLVLLGPDGEVVGGGRANPAAFPLHSAVLAARPDVVAVAHSHSPYGRAFSATGLALAPVSLEACIFYEDLPVLEDNSGVVLDAAEGLEVATALAGAKALVLRNHGLLTVGATVDEAAGWFVALERACQVQLLAGAVTHDPRVIDPQTARRVRATIGTADAGRHSFRPLRERILRTEPDVAE